MHCSKTAARAEGRGAAASEERGFAGVGESSHAARDPVEAGQAEDGVLSCRRSANPNDETEPQLPGPQRAVGNGLFRGYSKNRDKRGTADRIFRYKTRIIPQKTTSRERGRGAMKNESCRVRVRGTGVTTSYLDESSRAGAGGPLTDYSLCLSFPCSP